MHRFVTIFAVLIGSCVSASASADTRAFDCRPGAKPGGVDSAVVLQSVQRTYAGIRSLNGAFSQESFLTTVSSSETSMGKVWFTKPGMMRWNYESPEKQVALVRDDTMWLYQPEQNQVLIQGLDTVLLSKLPVAFLMGIGDLARDFAIDSACDGVGGTVLNLTPRGRSGGNPEEADALDTFALLVDPLTSLPKGAKVTDIAGNVNAILLDDLKVNENGSGDPSLFEAKFPKGTDVTDSRSAKGSSR